MQKWDDVPKSQQEFQIRLMEIFAGFLEHTDVQYGKIVDEMEHKVAGKYLDFLYQF